MKRIIYIITLGYIIGIIGELLINKVSFFICVLIFLNLFIKNFRLKTSSRMYRIIKVFIKNNTILIFLISMLISSIRLNYLKQKYEAVYNNFNEEKITVVVVSNKDERKYQDIYKVKLESSKFTDIYFLLKVPKKTNLNYGENIEITGKYTVPEKAKNYRGFNYSDYLKTKKIYGIIQTNKINKISDKCTNKIAIINNMIKQKIINNIRKVLPDETRELLLGILIGYDDNLQDDISESFNKSSINHLLAVSGMHITYLSFGILYLLTKIKIPKCIRVILLSILLINFMFITDFSSSVIRAGTITIISLISIVIYKKNDIKTTLSLPILFILIDNPYKVFDIGLILSYTATIGILVGSKITFKIKQENKIKKYVIDTLKVTVSANIFIIPIIAINFNTISFSFVISSLLISILIGPIVIGGFLLVLISFINLKISFIYGIVYNILLKILIFISMIISKIPFSQIIITTPNVFFIVLYFLLLYILINYIFLSENFSNRYIVKKIIAFKEKVFKIIQQNTKRIAIVLLIIVLTCMLFGFIPKKLKIFFIDVGQGDSTLIVTPKGKKILIDGGGAESYDIGKNILVPYLLDRGINKIDYIIISHFDTDHVRPGCLL